MTGTTKYTTCALCEATCGLELQVQDGRVLKVRGDAADVFSHGFICPKGANIAAVHEDPDRLRQPMVRRDGELVPATWQEAFEEIDRRLPPILEQHGRNSVGVYLGNPTVHNTPLLMYGTVLLKALGTRSIFTAASVDQMPKHVSSGLMFGSAFSIPIPDVDRTDYFLMLGANPMASNGSLMTAPDMRGRMRAIRKRGGKIVVIDPRRTRTADEADEHHHIRPGRDAHFLFALAHVIFDEGLDTLGDVAEHVDGVEQVRELARDFTPERAEAATSIPADDIRRIARELAAAPSAAVYGRIGTCTQEFGTLASWLVDVLNTITGNLDRPGGAMFPKPAAGAANTLGQPGTGRGLPHARWHSRVRGLPETIGEIPASCMAEEIETPGEGQVRAMITIAGNPTVSTPNAGRLAKALEGLDFMLSFDVYVNETTRHADVILPGPSPLERGHYDLAFYQLAVRNIVNWSPPVFEPDPGMPGEWETLLRVAAIVAGQGPDADVHAFDDFVAAEMVRREVTRPVGPLAGRDQAEVLAELEPRRGPERLLDLMLRAGPYDLTFDDLLKPEAEHGIDLGPLEPRMPEVLRTPSGRIELAPGQIVADVERLRASLERGSNGMVLIGRRQLRSNNSWMHNVPSLVRGKETCTALVHPDDAERFGLADGEPARVTSRAGSIELPVEITDTVMPGVVSIPHGWGHDVDGVRMEVAQAHAGANSNVLADETQVDALSGNAVLNGIPVELAPVREPVAAA